LCAAAGVDLGVPGGLDRRLRGHRHDQVRGPRRPHRVLRLAGFGDTQFSELRLFVFDASVDLEAAKKEPFSGTHFSLRLSPPWNQPEWVNKGVVDGAVVRDGINDSRQALLIVTGTAGNWQQSDPDDPPRLLGEIQPADANDPSPLAGPFDAVFCDAFVDIIIPE
jgi:hypothetical protein